MLVVSTAAGLGALLHILSVASLLEGLPGHVLLDVLALLPGGGGALPSGGAGAVLLVNILGNGGGDIAADLVRDIIADLTRCGDVITNLDKVNKIMAYNKARPSHTCLGTWLHFLLVTVEHLRSETSLVWILGTREQTRLDFCWQSLTGTSWQDWRFSSWQSTLGTWMHLISGTLEHS